MRRILAINISNIAVLKHIWFHLDFISVYRTLNLCTRRVSLGGIPTTQTAVIQKRLKAADPTMVPGPRSPALNPLPTISMQERRISGALDPRAMSVRLATVPFQIYSIQSNITWTDLIGFVGKTVVFGLFCFPFAELVVVGYRQEEILLGNCSAMLLISILSNVYFLNSNCKYCERLNE